MEEARHMIPAEHRPRWRRTRKGVAFTFGMAFMALLGMAVAAILIRGQINGGGSVSAKPTIKFDAVSHVSHDDLVAQCTVTKNATDDVATVTLNGTQGGECILQFNIYSTNPGVALKLQNVKLLDGVVNGAFVPPAACGQDINGTATPVQVRFTIPETAALGPFTAQADAGIQVTNAANWSLGACPA